VEIGLRVGLTDDDIVRVSRGPSGFDEPLDRALMQACDETVRDKWISDATWKILASHYDEKLLIEIVILFGHYIMVAGFLNSAGLVLESTTEAKLQAFHERVAAR